MLKYLLILLPFFAFGQGKILFQDDFENYNLSKWSWRDLCCTYSATKDSTHVKYGRYCDKILLNKSDPLVSGNRRAELLWNSNAYNTQTHTNVAWVAGSVMLDPGWLIDPNRPEAIFNIHDGEPCDNRATNPLGLWVNGDHYELVINYSGTDYCTGGYNTIVRKATLNLGPITPGKWEDWVIHFRNSTGPDGYDSVWHNGVLAGSYRGPNWYVGIFTEPYIKFGIYKWSWNFSDASAGGPTKQTTRILYQDNFKTGDTSCRLSTFTGAPPPPVNKPPVANAGPDQILQPGATSTTLRATGTDPEGGPLTYLWETFLSATGWLGTSTQQNWTITGYIPGKYGYKLTVTDNKGAKGIDTMYVIAQASNSAPVITFITNAVYTLPIATGSIDVVATDAENDSLSYVWKDDRDSIVSFMPSFTRKFTAAGSYIFNVTVSDGKLITTGQAKILVNPIPAKLILSVSSEINPKTGGLIVAHHHADGTVTYHEDD